MDLLTKLIQKTQILFQVKLYVVKTLALLLELLTTNTKSGARAVSVAGTDEIEVQLLEPIEFVAGEELEYGNLCT